MNRNLIGDRIPLASFFLHIESDIYSTYIAEISELHGARVRGQVYADACDEGFIIIDECENELPVTFVSTDTEGGEVVGWRFLATEEAVRRRPSLRGANILVIND